MLSKFKSVSINLGLSLISIILFILAMELVFPKILHKLPLPFYLGLGKDYKILGQYHKKSVIPVDYIAIVGDSHALGSGDWYHPNKKGYEAIAQVILENTSFVSTVE